MVLIRCGEGLGNRVAALANGLSRSATVRIRWEANEHLPVDWREIFPSGIDGVEFVQGGGGVTEWDGMSCERWGAAGDRGRANAAYGRIMRAMAGKAWITPGISVAARFLRNPNACPRSLAAAVGSRVQRPMRIYCFADSRRDELRQAFEDIGMEAVFPRASELASDLARDRAGMLAYLEDWHTLLASRSILALDGPSSALHPARAAGIKITYVPASRLQAGRMI